ncbi:MAG TPA: ferrous iron transport protein B, partial [Polyangiaceae bacterium]|nr:ferrous iron transport protein B [Polyangiaceae bacterium]
MIATAPDVRGLELETKRPDIVIIGNPNTGKTTLFNALTGESARVGNYPGITIERRVATLRVKTSQGEPLELSVTDLPGTYSLNACSPEERIAFDALLGLNDVAPPKLAVIVVDAGQLSRNLYLALQILELDVPVVMALNMIDEVGDNPPDARRLSEALGIPCVATSARRGIGMDALRSAIAAAMDKPPRHRPNVEYPKALLEDAQTVSRSLPEAWQNGVAPRQALALWALSSLTDDELTDVPPSLRSACQLARTRDPQRDIDLEIARARYAYIDSLLPAVSSQNANPPKRPLSLRIDRVLLHPVAGFAVFASVMLLLFHALFSWSEPLIGLVERGVSATQTGLIAHLPTGWGRDLLVEGVVGGVGNVVVFLPQIVLLFTFIGLLEDSGYMSRVAFLIDRVMRALGLHGRAFVPILSGFACAVPAIMATRTLERQRDRTLTMLVIPLTTCSARLPVYTLIISALFPAGTLFGWLPIQGALMAAAYLLAMILTLTATLVLGRTVVKGRQVPLILELPPYRMPSASATAKMVRERAMDFLRGAGTVILVCTVVLWALLSFPRTDASVAAEPHLSSSAYASTQPVPAPVAQGSEIENSYGAKLGKGLEPVIAPLGFDWRIGVGLVGAFAAREVFVSTMALVYGVGADSDDTMPLRERMRVERRADGSPRYSPLVGLSLLTFFAIA